MSSANAGPPRAWAAGEEKVARQHAAGKLTARDWIALLCEDFVELGVHARPHFSQRAMDGKSAPADGVITGWGRWTGGPSPSRPTTSRSWRAPWARRAR